MKREMKLQHPGGPVMPILAGRAVWRKPISGEQGAPDRLVFGACPYSAEPIPPGIAHIGLVAVRKDA